MNEKQRFNSLLRLYFGPSIIEDHTSPEGVKEVSEKVYSKLGRSMKGINRYLDKEALIEETHASLYEFVTDLKNDPLPVQYSRAAQADFDARHHAWCENRITAFKNSSKSVDDNYRTPEFVFTYGHAQLWINLTLKNLTILGHPTAVANYRYFHVPVNYARDVTLTDNLGVSRPPRRTPSTLLNRAQYWDYQQRLRAAGVDLINS